MVAPRRLPVGAKPSQSLGSAHRRNSQFAVSVSSVFSSQQGLRSCLSCLARFICCFPVLLRNKMSISGNDVPAELASLPLLTLLLFLRGFSSCRAALRLVLEAKWGCSCDLSQISAIGAALSPETVAVVYPAALLRARRTVQSAVAAFVGCTGMRCGGSSVASGWGGALLWHWFAVCVSLVFSSRRCLFSRRCFF